MSHSHDPISATVNGLLSTRDVRSEFPPTAETAQPGQALAARFVRLRKRRRARKQLHPAGSAGRAGLPEAISQLFVVAITTAGLALVPSACGGDNRGASPRANNQRRVEPAMENRTMEIVVQLREDVAFTRQGRIATSESAPVLAELQGLLSDLGVDLVPVHPGTEDPELATFFTVSGADPSQAEQITTALRGLDTVRAAYVKAPAELP